MMTRSRRSAAALRRIGPRPALLVRYVGHQAIARARQRRLRHSYAKRIGQPAANAVLRAPAIELPTLAELPEPLVTPATELRGYAEDAVAHRFDLLGAGRTDLGGEIDWHLDFKSGYRWPVTFYQDVVVTRLDDSSDAKVPWELSRCHHLVALARAARLFDDQRYAAEIAAQLDSWLDANPTGFGVNWVNAMEVGLRAVNWVWAIGTLGDRYPLDRDLRRRLACSLQAHGRHIAANLEGTPYLRSNHFLSDLLGLLSLGVAIDGDPAAPRWFRYAKRAFEREIQSQVYEDGVSFEASLSYHGLALEIFVLAAWIADRAGSAMSARYRQRLARMLDVSRAVRHPGGRIPQFGDNDSGRVLPASPSRPPTHDHLLWLGAALLGGERPLASTPDPEVAWTFGLGAWHSANDLLGTAGPARCGFPDGGLYVLAGEEAKAVVHCGGVGQNGNGGHAHNDALSFELSYSQPLIVDSGTYAYTFDPAARNAFRSTAAHNTVEVDDAEINPIITDELFRLPGVAHPRVRQWTVEPEATRLVVSHQGYRRLPGRVIHQRSFELDRRTDTLSVADELAGLGDCHARSYVHLAEGVELSAVDPSHFILRSADVSVEIGFEGFDEVLVKEGWVSASYGERTATSVLVGCKSCHLPARFGYSMRPLQRAAAGGSRMTRTEVAT